MQKIETSKTSAYRTKSSFTACFGLGRSGEDKQATKNLHHSFLGLALFYTS